MVNSLTENLLMCIPELDDDCNIPPDEQISEPSGGGFDKGDLAILLHGLISIINAAGPALMWFLYQKYEFLPSLSQYADDYFGFVGIIYWIAWQSFWSVHATLFGLPALFWLLSYMGYGPRKAYIKLLNVTYFASFLLYPVLLGAFGFTASPYVLKTKTQRENANYGLHNEE